MLLGKMEINFWGIIKSLQKLTYAQTVCDGMEFIYAIACIFKKIPVSAGVTILEAMDRLL